MINSFMTAIPFAPFISFGVSMLNQFASSTNAESLEILFEDVVYEKKTLRDVQLVINYKNSINIKLNTRFNIEKIILDIDPSLENDIEKFVKYIKNIDHIRLNKSVKEILEKGYDINTLVIGITKMENQYKIWYKAAVFKKGESKIEYSTSLAVVTVSAESFKEVGMSIGGREVDPRILNKVKAKQKDIIARLYNSTDMVQKIRKFLLEEKFDRKISSLQFDQKSLERRVDEMSNLLNDTINKLNNLNDIVTKLAEDYEKSKYDYFKGDERVVNYVNDALGELGLMFKRIDNTLEEFKKELKQNSDLANELRGVTNKLEEELRSIKERLNSVNNDVEKLKSGSISQKSKALLQRFVLIFLKPFMFLSNAIKTVILKLFKKDNNQNKTEAKTIASLIARFEYYSIVYENSETGKISSIITKVIQFIKDVVKGSYNAVKELVRWFSVNSAKILSTLISAIVNVLQKSNNVLRDFVNRYNKT